LQGSKAQLEEVWEKGDEMDPEDFDPKTFFSMHGSRHTSVMCLSDFLAFIILNLFGIIFAMVNS